MVYMFLSTFAFSFIITIFLPTRIPQYKFYIFTDPVQLFFMACSFLQCILATGHNFLQIHEINNPELTFKITYKN